MNLTYRVCQKPGNISIIFERMMIILHYATSGERRCFPVSIYYSHKPESSWHITLTENPLSPGCVHDTLPNETLESDRFPWILRMNKIYCDSFIVLDALRNSTTFALTFPHWRGKRIVSYTYKFKVKPRFAVISHSCWSFLVFQRLIQ